MLITAKDFGYLRFTEWCVNAISTKAQGIDLDTDGWCCVWMGFVDSCIIWICMISTAITNIRCESIFVIYSFVISYFIELVKPSSVSITMWRGKPLRIRENRQQNRRRFLVHSFVHNVTKPMNKSFWSGQYPATEIVRLSKILNN